MKADAVGEAMLIEKVRHAVSEDAWQEVARVAERRFRLRRSLADWNADPRAPGSDEPFADAALSARSRWRASATDAP
jgi:hypothetical protein